MFKTLMRNGFPCIIENTRASRLWYVEEVAEFNAQGAQLLTMDMCAYGTRSRKRTGLLVCHLEAQSCTQMQRLCGERNKLCGHTKRPHVHLKGKDPRSGRNWTSLGQVYPRQFCKSNAQVPLRKPLTRTSEPRGSSSPGALCRSKRPWACQVVEPKAGPGASGWVRLSFVHPMVRSMRSSAGDAGASSSDAKGTAGLRLSCHKWFPDESDAYLAIKVIAAGSWVFVKVQVLAFPLFSDSFDSC